MYSLDNKVAIITGAGGKSGIGRSVANRLSKEGAKIIVTDIVENPYPEEGWNGLSSVVEEIILSGGEATQIVSDVTDFSSINNLIKEAIKHKRNYHLGKNMLMSQVKLAGNFFNLW